MNDERCAMPDYESECNRLCAENAKLREELAYHRGKEAELARIKAQLDIVYLIFGGQR